METIEVAAGVIFNQEGKIMICQRMGKLEGLWEFPGGKLEEGETPQTALQRELLEELELSVETGEEIRTVEVRDAGRNLVLHFVKAKAIEETKPVLHVHKALCWISKNETSEFEFCPADTEFLKKERWL